MTITIRLFVSALILLVIYGPRRYRDRGMPTELAHLEMKLQDEPASFGEWKGEAVALDPEMFKATGAAMTCDRVYHDRHRESVSLHTAVFDKPYQMQALWHPPEFAISQPDGVSRVEDESPWICRLSAVNLARLDKRAEQWTTQQVDPDCETRDGLEPAVGDFARAKQPATDRT